MQVKPNFEKLTFFVFLKLDLVNINYLKVDREGCIYYLNLSNLFSMTIHEVEIQQGSVLRNALLPWKVENMVRGIRLFRKKTFYSI